MGIFGQSGPEAGQYNATLGGIAKEPCKIDYEKLIADTKKRRDATQSLYNSLHEYVDINGGEYADTYKLLIGSLIVDMRGFDKQIVQFIALHEAATK